MTRTIRDVLSGNDDEQPWQPQLDKVVTCLADDGPIVVWIHGPIGAGKTSLLAAFGDLAAERGAAVVSIDCRTVEPTEAGLLQELSEVLGESQDSLASAAAAASALAERVILAFDNYEVFRLADAWLRREFIPQLAASARIMMVSGEPPAAGWISATEWQRHFLPVSLAASADLDPPEQARRYLADVVEPATRRAIDADESSSTAWAALGLVQYRLHRHQEAGESLHRALQLDPTNKFAHDRLKAFHR